MAETTSNKAGLTAPPNSPIQGATAPPSCDEIQSCSLMDPIPTTRMREQLEDEPPQSSSSSRAPSPCQPVTLRGNSIALSRANYARREDDEIIHASAPPSLKDNVSPNNSPPLNHLLIRLNQNALLACGLFNHWWPSNPFALWDVQYLNQYGVEVYTWYLLAFTELSTSKQRKRYESNAQWLELRLHDLQAHLQLRDYAVLEAEFSDRQTPEAFSPNSPIQGATAPPSCDEIQSCSLMDLIPTTRMREQLEDEPPQSSSSSRAPSPCQPVTLRGNSIALSRANYGRREDDEIIHASATPSLKDNVSPNNSPPLNHLLIRLNQNALLACGLFNHWWPSNPFALWDVQYLNQYGVEVYTWYLLAFTELSTSKQRKRYESNAQWLELRLHDLQAHLQLRDYAVLEAEFSDRQTPEGMTTRAMLCQLQRFQEAALSDFAHWPSESYDDAVAIFLTKCLARLRFTASLAALQADPARVMATIYWKFERTLQSDGLSSNLPSPCITDQADFFEEYYCKSWLADVSDDSDDDNIGWWSA
ncbi:hypothetical protein FOCG_17711 [Fusarium oxysporum f. sp. radicis-lycopersici 26381]|nr:hypothetical protein FOCG_17711 [Fusarium oxysporum f. sp. radicis-lycopersici 26381]